MPTPIDGEHRPDLTPVLRASETIGKALSRGSVVVYESTVYPGVTEDICGPALEAASGLVRGVDFKLGYSPERINPGDREPTFEKIVKVVSGEDSETLERVAQTYGAVVDAGVYRAESIRVAEAAKPMVHDPLVTPEQAIREYGLRMAPWEELQGLDALILAVPHRELLARSPTELLAPLRPGGVLLDLKCALRTRSARPDVQYWSL